MSNGLEKKLKEYLAAKEDEKFQKRLKKTWHAYDLEVRSRKKQLKYYYGWLARFEEHITPQAIRWKRPGVGLVPLDQCGEKFSLKALHSDIVLFYESNGKLEENTAKIFADYFLDHPEVDIVYADEDILTRMDGDEELPDIVQRTMPYLKPCWSEDTLLSFQYFGKIFAVRRKKFVDIPWKGTSDYKINLYDFLLRATELGKVEHLDSILLHCFAEGESEKEIEDRIYYSTDFWGTGAEFNEIKNDAIRRRGYQGEMVLDEATGFFHPVYECTGEPLVSIVIPSKDNPDVLKVCLESVYRFTEYKNFEIVVIDNGSSSDNKQKIESLKDSYPFSYYYEPMDFNFSRMCNIGVSKAKGEYILLLNDDMEIIDGKWLSRMLGQAMLPYVGAVGAKLLYPNSTIIQHAGVYSTYAGPGHKTGTQDDTKSYYFGRNKLVYDLIGVTGACLLVKKEKYEAVGGLYEGLAITYNDVDLCFNLHEAGYNNVQRNDVILYHHESLSRGNDLLDENKIKRLNKERDHLFERHPDFARKDPYLGDIYNMGTFHIEMIFMNKRPYCEEIVPVRSNIAMDENVENVLIHYCVEQCKVPAFEEMDGDEEFHYWLQGWFYLRCRDNSRFKRKLLLKNPKGEVWEIPTSRFYRKDVSEVFQDEINIELTGFNVWIYEGLLPQDDYELWLYAEDTCLEEKVYCKTEHVLHVTR